MRVLAIFYVDCRDWEIYMEYCTCIYVVQPLILHTIPDVVYSILGGILYIDWVENQRYVLHSNIVNA